MKRVVGCLVSLTISFLFLSSVSAAHENDIKNIFKFEKIKISSQSEYSASPSSNDDYTISHDFLISLNKGSLKQNFLLTPMIVTAGTAPLPESLGSKVVYFEHKGNDLILLENQTGKLHTEGIEVPKLITTFPITEETDSFIKFDFKKGMDALFVTDSFYVSEMKDMFQPEFDDPAVPVAQSYLDVVKYKDNLLWIEHVAQIKEKDKRPTVKVYYLFQPYEPSQDFKVKESNLSEDVGYFEMAPLVDINTAYEFVPITKWNLNKGPIVYYYTKNTPEEYKQAVRDGVLYWNKVAHKAGLENKIVDVQELPEGIDPLDPNYNVIHWVKWDGAGFAYADMQADPWTGEMKKVQVILTSAFAFYSKETARELYFRLKKQDHSHVAHGMVREKFGNAIFKKGIGLSSFKHTGLCDYDFSPDFLSVLVHIAHGEMHEADILRLSQDEIRQVTAHEVGHTLGLRHNFAGSLDSTIPEDKAESIFDDYLKAGTEYQKYQPANSVMEYLSGKDDFLAGGLLQEPLDVALTYDTAALEWGYTEKQVEEVQFGAFCTDGHAFKHNKGIDCAQFDSGPNPIKTKLASIEKIPERAAFELAQWFIQAKAPVDPRDIKKVQEVEVDTDMVAAVYGEAVYNFLQYFKKGTSFYKIQKELTPLLSQEEKQRAHLNFMIKTLKALGGYEKVIPQLLQFKSESKDSYHYTLPLVENMKTRFSEILEKEDFRKGKTSYGASYEFTEDEIEYIEQYAEKYFKDLEVSLVSANLDALNGVNPALNLLKKYVPPEILEFVETEPATYASFDIETLQNLISELDTKVIVAQSKDEITEKFEDGTELKVFKPLFSLPMRSQSGLHLKMQPSLMPELLNNPLIPLMFSGKAKIEIQDRVNSVLRLPGSIFGGEKERSVDQLPEDLKTWVKKEQKLLQEL